MFPRLLARGAKRATKLRSSVGPRNIDEYIAGFRHDVRKPLEQVRTTIKKAAPDAEEAIKYRIPTFVLNENLVHFAAFKNHVGFYPTPSAIETFTYELSSYQGAKGSVQFSLDTPMPLCLIGKIVRFRIKEVRAKSAAKRRSGSGGQPPRGPGA